MSTTVTKDCRPSLMLEGEMHSMKDRKRVERKEGKVKERYYNKKQNKSN